VFALCTNHLKALPVSVINSLNASGSKNAAAYESALGDIETAVQKALVTVKQRASNNAVAGRAQEQVLDAVGKELAKVITNVDTVVDGMAGDVKSQPPVVRLSVLRGIEMPDLRAGGSIRQHRRCGARPCPRCGTPASR
jgi:hypothetical protein